MNFPLSKLCATIEKTYSRVHLGNFPTPVEPISFPTNGTAWIKRDDLSSSIYGGNKTRKLEFLLKDNGRPVLTFGPLGSHHVYSTALHAKALNKKCGAILVPQKMTDHHQEIYEGIKSLCDPLFIVGVKPLDFYTTLKSTIKTILSGNFRYDIVGPGGTSPLGTLGFVLGAIELAQQIERGELPMPKKVFVPLGTGGTAVGLAIGFAMCGLNIETVAVRVVPKLTLPAISLSHLMNQTLQLLKKALPSVPKKSAIQFHIENTFHTGYAHPSKEAMEALAIGKDAGIPLETTYSAKAFAALLDELKLHPENGPVLFWQTFFEK